MRRARTRAALALGMLGGADDGFTPVAYPETGTTYTASADGTFTMSVNLPAGSDDRWWKLRDDQEPLEPDGDGIPEWEVGLNVVANESYVQRNGTKYLALVSHETHAGWIPGELGTQTVWQDEGPV